MGKDFYATPLMMYIVFFAPGPCTPHHFIMSSLHVLVYSSVSVGH